MTEQTQTDGADIARKTEENRAALQALAAAFGSSMDGIARKTEAEKIATLGFTVMFAAMAETVKLQPERLAVVLGAVTKGQPVEFQQQVAAFITGIINIGLELPRAMATAEAAYRADQDKVGNTASKAN